MSELIVVSDGAGFIGVFDCAAKMAAAFTERGIPSHALTQRFATAPEHADSPCSTTKSPWAWLVPLADNGHVVFASKDRAAADAVRTRYAEAGLVFDDDIDYWQQRLNEVRPEAAARYAPLPESEAELEKLAREDDERSAALMRPRPGGPLEKAIADNAPLVGIGHFVVAADDFDIADAIADVAGAADTVAGATNTVAGATDTVASATDTVSGATDTVSGAMDTVAGATDTVAGATDTVAGATDTVAGATDTVAGVTDTVASAADTVAGVTDVVASATDTVSGAADTVASATDTETKEHAVHSVS